MAPDMQSDIEIYIKHTTAKEIISWLESLFEKVSPLKHSGKVSLLSCTNQQSNFQVEIVSEAVGKNFTSVWFQSDKTPWKSDLNCAKEAFLHFQSEVRCSEGDWKEEDEIPEKQLWWRVNEDGEKRVIWN